MSGSLALRVELIHMRDLYTLSLFTGPLRISRSCFSWPGNHSNGHCCSKETYQQQLQTSLVPPTKRAYIKMKRVISLHSFFLSSLHPILFLMFPDLTSGYRRLQRPKVVINNWKHKQETGRPPADVVHLKTFFSSLFMFSFQFGRSLSALLSFPLNIHNDQLENHKVICGIWIDSTTSSEQNNLEGYIR